MFPPFQHLQECTAELKALSSERGNLAWHLTDTLTDIQENSSFFLTKPHFSYQRPSTKFFSPCFVIRSLYRFPFRYSLSTVPAPALTASEAKGILPATGTVGQQADVDLCAALASAAANAVAAGQSAQTNRKVSGPCLLQSTFMLCVHALCICACVGAARMRSCIIKVFL